MSSRNARLALTNAVAFAVGLLPRPVAVTGPAPVAVTGPAPVAVTGTTPTIMTIGTNANKATMKRLGLTPMQATLAGLMASHGGRIVVPYSPNVLPSAKALAKKELAGFTVRDGGLYLRPFGQPEGDFEGYASTGTVNVAA